MSTRLPITLGARVLVLSLILGVYWHFNNASTLAAKNRGAATASAQAGNSRLTGQLIATGSVSVNEKQAITGTTIFTGSRIVVDCANGNSAVVNLGMLGRLELTAGARLTLRLSDGLISGELVEGKVLISTLAGVKVAINTPNGVTSAGGGEAAVTPVVAALGARCAAGAAGGAAGSSPQGAGGSPVPATNRTNGATVALLTIFGIGNIAATATAFSATSEGEGSVPPARFVVSPTAP